LALSIRCKRCCDNIKIEYDGSEYDGSKTFFAVNGPSKEATSAFSLFNDIKNDQNYICDRCRHWLYIIDMFKKKFGWNPKWKTALSQFEKLGLQTKGQADPIDFNRILNRNDIVMSQQVIDVWNRTFDDLHGTDIIKCYSVPDSLSGEIEQHVGRVMGGITSGLRRFFR